MNVCKMPGCDNRRGMKDRDDYKSRSVCSVKCEVRLDHLRDDARDARLSQEAPDDEW